jgi:putative molybdopterin biosynthesis protein
MTEYFTTRELAEFLRIKERKVYDLAASGKVPCSKAMGKLLFPRAEIEAWVASQQTGPQSIAAAAPLPNVFLGSHDPLLEWALREARCGLAMYFDSSMDGLRRFQRREGIATGLHLYDATAKDWNTPAVLGACTSRSVVLIEWARRQRGLIATPARARKLKGIKDLDGLRIAARQEDAGAQILLRRLLEDEGISPDECRSAVLVRSENDAALAVLEGKADVCFGLKSLAAQYRLGFVPVIEERFDLLVDRRSWFEPPLQALLRFCQDDAFRQRASELAGYDIDGFGTVHLNGSS